MRPPLQPVLIALPDPRRPPPKEKNEIKKGWRSPARTSFFSLLSEDLLSLISLFLRENAFRSQPTLGDSLSLCPFVFGFLVGRREFWSLTKRQKTKRAQRKWILQSWSGTTGTEDFHTKQKFHGTALTIELCVPSAKLHHAGEPHGTWRTTVQEPLAQS